MIWSRNVCFFLTSKNAEFSHKIYENGVNMEDFYSIAMDEFSGMFSRKVRDTEQQFYEQALWIVMM